MSSAQTERTWLSLSAAAPDTQGSPRFFSPDLETLLSCPEGPLDLQASRGEANFAANPKRPRHKVVERGIYRSTTSGLLSERPFIEGRRTWRTLATTKITVARAELRQRKAARQSGEEEPEPEYLKKVGEVIRHYQDADYPDKQLNARSDRTKKEEARHCVLLLKFWDAVRVKKASIVSCDQYRDWRLKRLKQGTGLRTIDRELTAEQCLSFRISEGASCQEPSGRSSEIPVLQERGALSAVHARRCQ
jgi:hypothetical protein